VTELEIMQFLQCLPPPPPPTPPLIIVRVLFTLDSMDPNRRKLGVRLVLLVSFEIIALKRLLHEIT
jgi:hypothetical protein